MRKWIIIGLVAVVAIGAYLLRDQSETQTVASGAGAALAEVTLPDSLSQQAQIGKAGYDAVCAACHGADAAGQDGVAPPLVHVIYEPGHHGDESFQRAVSVGVQSHHWRFGNMPAIADLTRADVAAIITYVRELQRANGIN